MLLQKWLKTTNLHLWHIWVLHLFVFSFYILYVFPYSYPDSILHCISLFMLLVHAKNKPLNAWQSDSISFLPILDLPIKNSICICVNLVLKFYGDKITFWREFQIEKRQEAEIHIVSLVVLLFVLCTEQMKPHKPLAFDCAETEFNGQVSPPSTCILLSLSKPLLSHCLPTPVFSFLTSPQGAVWACKGYWTEIPVAVRSDWISPNISDLKINQCQQKNSPTLMWPPHTQ